MLKTSYLEGEKKDSIADTYVTKTLRKETIWVGWWVDFSVFRERTKEKDMTFLKDSPK